MLILCSVIVLSPLFAAILIGLAGKILGRKCSHWIANIGVALSFFLSTVVLYQIATGAEPAFNENIYTWLEAGGVSFHIGFLIDTLTALMMVVVTFVSWMVHIYTIGYMSEDSGYQRFFSYISLFTFSMLMLVMSNNFLQLFFGWEAVGLVSYLLIGFWFKKESAIYANLKAFLVNRVGDFGFLLGIAGILTYFGTLDYAAVFEMSGLLEGETFSILPGLVWESATVLCILLFIGAMGKSAQVPLHVWLPDSMEGPTPISALIHAATMVTAGIFMVARMSPLYEMSPTALEFIMAVGALTAFFMGLLGLVQNDIKRVVAYSTLSQLGYMTVALGASAYAAAIFHLFTHAFFKALLFLGAGSVIIGMHHVQDMRHMGGLKKFMPLTYWTCLIGTLALIGFPGFSGFYSKDMIIEVVHAVGTPLSGIIYWALLVGVFVTALYSFRLLFLVFHGEERFNEETRSHLSESPYVVTVPLMVLAVPSVLIGAVFVESALFGGFFNESIRVGEDRNYLDLLGENFQGSLAMMTHGFVTLPFWAAISGIIVAWYLYLKAPNLPATIASNFSIIYNVLNEKYGFDRFNSWFFSGGARGLGGLLWKRADILFIDGVLVNGSAKLTEAAAFMVRKVQSGYLYHYAFGLIAGLLIFLLIFVY